MKLQSRKMLIDGLPVDLVSMYRIHEGLDVKASFSTWNPNQLIAAGLSELRVRSVREASAGNWQLVGGLEASGLPQVPLETPEESEGLDLPWVGQVPPENGSENTGLVTCDMTQLPPAEGSLGYFLPVRIRHQLPHQGGVRSVEVDDCLVTEQTAMMICLLSRTEIGRKLCRDFLQVSQSHILALTEKADVLKVRVDKLTKSLTEGVQIIRDNEATQLYLPQFEDLAKRALVPIKPVKPRKPSKPQSPPEPVELRLKENVKIVMREDQVPRNLALALVFEDGFSLRLERKKAQSEGGEDLLPKA